MLKCKVYSFETLDVWKEARKFAVKVYKLTKKLPTDERYGLVSQMRRSGISISTNIAEGSSRESLKDQARFSEISFGSLLELLNHSILCYDLEFISESELFDLRIDVDSIGFKLDGLRKSQLKRFKENRKPKSSKKSSSNKL
ncbi:MAG TPA: four helix bundle protein [Saprospiraceae bacterium]|jgi:four helix bundle protein